GNIPEKIVGIIKKIRQPIDKGLDKIVAWLGGLLKKIGGAIAQAGLPADPNERFKQGMDLAEKAVNRFSGKKVGKIVLTPLIAGIKVRYGFQVLDIYQSDKNWWIKGVLNPTGDKKTYVEVEETGSPTGVKEKKMPLMSLDFDVKKSIHEAVDKEGISLWVHYEQQLQLQENKLRSMSIQTWIGNITQFYGDKGKGIAAKGRSKEGKKIAEQIRARLVAAKAKELRLKDNTLSIDSSIDKAKAFYKDKAVLHVLDQGGGGEGAEFLGDLLNAADQEIRDEVSLGNARVDFAIGPAWPPRARELKQKIEDKVDSSVFSSEKMNVKLKAVKK
ncbi:MAG: polymorphic toxin type 15 domain-containing protein, partial [Methylococcaceae bacterium]|nr:polymorphic toxin type 15 domain-containing protein [Methylococcaceae bacterium]